MEYISLVVILLNFLDIIVLSAFFLRCNTQDVMILCENPSLPWRNWTKYFLIKKNRKGIKEKAFITPTCTVDLGQHQWYQGPRDLSPRPWECCHRVTTPLQSHIQHLTPNKGHSKPKEETQHGFGQWRKTTTCTDHNRSVDHLSDITTQWASRIMNYEQERGILKKTCLNWVVSV